MKCTIKDIARLAGVSPSTVSRVMSGSPRISGETRARVERIMREAGYQPNQLARLLVQRRSNIVAAVLPAAPERALGEPFFFEVLRGITMAATRAGCHVLLSAAGPEGEAACVRALVQGGIAGGILLLRTREDDAAVAELTAQGFPFALLGHPAGEDAVNWVDNDNFAAGRAAARHLIGRGCRRLCYCGHSPGFRMSALRLDGCREAAREAGLPPPRVIERPAPPEAGPDAGGRVDAETVRAMFAGDGGPGDGWPGDGWPGDGWPDGVVAENDLVAAELMALLRALHLRVPEDVSVVGFNDAPLAQLLKPPLTSVNLCPEELGRRTCELLLDAMDAHSPDGRPLEPRSALVPFTLIERESVRRGDEQPGGGQAPVRA